MITILIKEQLQRTQQNITYCTRSTDAHRETKEQYSNIEEQL
jgi:hypothetical protein